MADKTCEKVYILDLEYSRIQSTITLLDNIMEIKSCAVSVQKALALNDLEKASAQISIFLSQDSQMIQSIFIDREDLNSSSQFNSFGYLLEDGSCPVQILQESKEKLSLLISNGFDTGVLQGDKLAMSRHLKLFPLIGELELGMAKLAKYLNGIISKQCQDAMKLATSTPSSSTTTTTNILKNRIYVDSLSKMYESVAIIFDQQVSLITNIFGKSHLVYFLDSLQKEADKQACLLISSFYEYRNLERRLSEIKVKDDSKAIDGLMQDLLNPVVLDSILSEIASLFSKTALFDKFLESRMNELNQESHSTQVVLKSDALNALFSRLVTAFISIQDFYIKQSVSKALEIDSIEKDASTSSCVDDVFFVFKSCAHRALSTLDPNIFVSTLSSIGMSLEQDYLNFLTLKFHSCSGNLESKEGRYQFMILLNNLDTSHVFILKLTKNLELEMKFEQSDVLKKIRASLSSLNEEASSLRNALKSWNETMCNQIIRPRLKPIIMQSFGGDVKYTLTDEEYAEHQSNQVFLNRFATNISKLTFIYKKVLTEYNYNQVFLNMMEHLFKEWERHVLSLKFNSLGATRFDEDLRSATAYLATLCSWSFRDKFARLNQICTLLNLDNVQEIFEYWGTKAGPMAWKLTGSEVKKILSCRIEFPLEQVNKLQL